MDAEGCVLFTPADAAGGKATAPCLLLLPAPTNLMNSLLHLSCRLAAVSTLAATSSPVPPAFSFQRRLSAVVAAAPYHTGGEGQEELVLASLVDALRQLTA